MGNAYAVEPQLDPDFPRVVRTWTDPFSGIVVPKIPEQNLQWRADMLAAAENDRDLQIDLMTACSKSPLFFANAFCFTLLVSQVTETGERKQAEHKHVPFVTWEIQDKHLLRIEQAIDDGRELLTDKSRTMGATWDHIISYTRRFIFRADESHLLMSRKEDAVDILDGMPKNYPHASLADPGTLFGKIDYILSRLPEWMLPRMTRKKLHLVNLDNHTRIDGESSNATAGSSDRRTSIFLDEMAKMDEGESIKRSTRDVAACRLVCSTPHGAGTAYSKWRMSGTIPVFILPWWEHPAYGRGRYIAKDVLGRYQIRSPWYNEEEKKRSPKELATEVDMDHVGSGDVFFEAMVIEQHKKMFARPPACKMYIKFKKGLSDDKIKDSIARRVYRDVAIFPNAINGPWKIWGALERGRPDQTRSYTIGIDVGKGQGASNSVMSIICNETKEKIAEYADANTPPHELAKLACAAAVWAGGRSRPLVIWENNGDPGFDFGRQIVHVYNYPNVYFDRVVGTITEKRGKRYGWRSNAEKKATALGILRRAYARNEFINHSEEALTECLSYVHFEGGGIGPAELMEESDSARKCHGDRVIADMLCIVGQKDAPKFKRQPCAIPQFSIGGRLREFQRRKKNAKRSDRFDFSIQR
jgi:hypothetical protein